MDSNRSEWRIIDKAQRTSFLGAPYNPPDCDRATFRKEWYGVYTEIKRELEKEWSYGLGDEDFFIDSDCPSDRFIGVAIGNERMIDRRAVATVQKVLARLKVDYLVDFCNGSVFLRTHEDEAYPDFNIIVEKRRVSVYSESHTVYDRLGLTRPTTLRDK